MTISPSRRSRSGRRRSSATCRCAPPAGALACCLHCAALDSQAVLCAQVSNINTANINDQTYDEVDDELRATAWYKELERQMEEERLRRVAAEEERARRQAEAEAKAAAEAEAKAAKKGGKKKKK